MPIDLRRRDDIAAAVDAYDRTHPSAPLPRKAPTGCSPSCFPLTMCASEAWMELAGGRVRPKGRLPDAAGSARGWVPVQADQREARPEHLSAPSAAGAVVRSRREKVFGPGRAVPLDGNAKARIQAYARAWSGRNRQPGQHKGPITRAFLDVLQALLWGFHNSPHRRLLPELRTDRRQGRVRPLHRRRGAEGAGAGRRAVLAAQADPDPRGLHRPVRPPWLALEGHPHQQRLRLQRPESGGFRLVCFSSPKIRREH